MIRPALAWQPRAASKATSDIPYDFAEGIARIVIKWPERRNAFRPKTVAQRINTTHDAQFDPQVGVSAAGLPISAAALTKKPLQPQPAPGVSRSRRQ